MARMRCVALRKSPLILCFAALISSTLISSTLWAQGKVLDFEEDPKDQTLMPEGCNNPFREPIRFINFFQTALATMAADRGAGANGVTDLFAVAKLRDLINARSSGGEETAVDRLIVSQLCQYEKISAQTKFGSGTKLVRTESKDPHLQDHLAKIAKKLLADTVELYRAQNKEQSKIDEQKKFMNSRKREIERAKDLGDKKARSLI